VSTFPELRNRPEHDVDASHACRARALQLRRFDAQKQSKLFVNTRDRTNGK